MKSAKEIQQFSPEELNHELQEMVTQRRKLVREIDNIDTYLVGLREERRCRHEKNITNITSGGDSDDVSF